MYRIIAEGVHVRYLDSNGTWSRSGLKLREVEVLCVQGTVAVVTTSLGRLIAAKQPFRHPLGMIIVGCFFWKCDRRLICCCQVHTARASTENMGYNGGEGVSWILSTGCKRLHVTMLEPPKQLRRSTFAKPQQKHSPIRRAVAQDNQ